jgi:hypothetical protein
MTQPDPPLTRDQIDRLILRTPPGQEPRPATLMITLTPMAFGAEMRLHIIRQGITNHLLRDIITGLFLSLAEADQVDELVDIASYRDGHEVPPWSSRTIAEKLKDKRT